MVIELMLLIKSHRTDNTIVYSSLVIAIMHIPMMKQHIMFVGKRSVTDWTGEWLLSRVCAHVFIQMRRTSKLPFANGTFLLPDIQVTELMVFERRIMNKFFATKIALQLNQ